MARLRADGKFRSSLHGAYARRFLAAVEHLALDMVPRLRVHPAWRLTRVRMAVGAQRARHVPALGPVARRQLELRDLGPVSRRVAGDHARAPDPASGERSAAWGWRCRRCPTHPAGGGDVPADAVWLAAVPGDRVAGDRPRP